MIFRDLPGPYAAWNGVTMWVAGPQDVSELGGLDDDTPPTSKMATLGCEPLFMDWSTIGLAHIFHEGIIPGGTYDIQLVHACAVGSEDDFSDPLVLATAR